MQTADQRVSNNKKRKLSASSGNDEESDLLASLGSSVQNMDQYEAEVLKTAEMEQTPRLNGMGFPPLQGLAPSGHPLSDLPHAQATLAKVRTQLVSQPHNLSLLLKQQVLLNLIHTTSGDHELCLRPQEEIRLETVRRRRFLRLAQKEASKAEDERAYPTSNQNKINEGDATSLTRTHSSMLKSSLRKDTLNSNNKMQSSLSTETDAEEAASNRLEEIKAGRAKSVSFATKMTATTTIPSHRRRIGIQKRKVREQKQAEGRQRRKDGGEEGEETDTELQRRRDRLKELRADRERRREKRRQRWMASERSRTRDTSNDDNDDDEGETEFEFGDNKGNTDEVTSPEVDSSDSVIFKEEQVENGCGASDPVTETDTQLEHQPFIKQEKSTSCPLCGEQIIASSANLLDETLSHHMNDCQNGTLRRTRGRGSQRGSSQRTPACKTVNYNEADVHDEESNDSDTSKDFIFDKDEEDDVLEADSIEGTDLDDENVKEFGGISKKKIRSHSAPAKLSTPPLIKESIDDFDEEDYEDRVDDWILNGINRMRVMKERDTRERPPGEEVYDGGLVIPQWVNDRLFPYQRTGLQWMWELHQQQAGGIIGDEMGLGKTVQLAAFLGCMAASRKLKSILIIAPATMLQHWLNEMKTWAPGIRRILIHQSAETGGTPFGLAKRANVSSALLRNMEDWLKDCRRHRLFEPIDEDDYEDRGPNSFCGTGYALVTTYENVRRNPDVWTCHRWSYIVMDEAQKIRNPDAEVTLACKRLRTPHRLALSGTPIQNDLKELWSLFDFVFPGRLGTLPAFENEFSVPIKKGGYSNASPMQVQLAYRCAVMLKSLIAPYLLRRLKKDIKEVNRMPGKKEQVLFCRLTDRQRIMYESFLASDQVKQVLRGSMQMLGAITMLRKICNHPDLVCPPDESSLSTFLQKGFFSEADLLQDYSDADDDIDEEESLTERSGKLEVLAKILPLWKKQGHRVLIFCQWKKMLNIIQRFTDMQGWKFGRLDGSTNVAARQRLVDTFNSDESYYGMLMTTRTGGVGLNLTGADRIILYDPDWNPQTDAQARERAWRFGQEREVTIYRLIAAGTVEEKIYQRQIFKTALSNRVLEDARQRRLFSQKDLRDLFSLKVDGGSVASGSEGITETGELTKGDGYIDPDQDPSETGANKDDGETMESVLKSKGLAGVFDHSVVESNRVSKRASVREMEEKAKQAARAALGALKESVIGHDSFTPTWTGSEETQQTGRFGESSGAAASALLRRSSSSVAYSPAGIGMRDPGADRSSSGSLLASIRQQKEDIRTAGTSYGADQNRMGTTQQYTNLLKRIREFVRRTVPTTEELLDEFTNVKNYDAAVFRRLLKSVASMTDGRWRLKDR